MLTPLEQHCLDAVKKWGGEMPTYVVKNAVRRDQKLKTVATPKVLSAMKSLEQKGLVKQADRSQRQYVWALPRETGE
ncbi:hypothetical protein [Salinicola sp. CR57]|uniref:hypothetical protein n=1 Tax=Salinicola sp. CR57 TaxID=1949086 RepID=UPI000DA1B013|nr:hypothetical protein [Salinicola sp. CR57]